MPHLPEVHQIPFISTSHLTKEVAATLLALSNDNPWCPCASWEYGAFIFLDDLEAKEGGVPQCLIDIRDWRMKLEIKGMLDNSRWVRVDAEGSVVEGLPVYDWESSDELSK